MTDVTGTTATDSDATTETVLLEAAEETLRRELGLADDECSIEPDDMPPATVGHKFIAVIPNGWVPGPAHSPSGGVVDEIISIEISVTVRSEDFPRDRKKKKFLGNLTSLNNWLDRIMNEIDFIYSTMNRANELLQEREGEDTEGFHHPLVFAGMQSRPAMVSAEHFAAKSGSTSAGLQRSIYFGEARRTRSR